MIDRLRLATCTLLLVAVLGCDRITGPSPSESDVTLDAYTVTIIDSSSGPKGGTSRIHQDDPSGLTIHQFESANGRYKLQLNGNVLNFNGDRYTLGSPSDVIRIVEERLTINGVEPTPDPEPES